VTELSPPQEMIRRFMEIVPARAILVAAKLGIADHISADGATATQLAAKLNADADALHRLLQVLASIDILREATAHRFMLTSLGETLRSDLLRAGALRIFWPRCDDFGIDKDAATQARILAYSVPN
jgi:predicted transcriptional regulator